MFGAKACPVPAAGKRRRTRAPKASGAKSWVPNSPPQARRETIPARHAAAPTAARGHGYMFTHIPPLPAPAAAPEYHPGHPFPVLAPPPPPELSWFSYEREVLEEHAYAGLCAGGLLDPEALRQRPKEPARKSVPSFVAKTCPEPPAYLNGWTPEDVAREWACFTRDAVATATGRWAKLCWRPLSFRWTREGALATGPQELIWMEYGTGQGTPASFVPPFLLEAAKQRFRELYAGAVPPVQHHLGVYRGSPYKIHYRAMGTPSLPGGCDVWLY